MNYPHLIETTLADYQQRTYTLGLGVTMEDLTPEEYNEVRRSNAYIHEYEIERDRKLLKAAYDAFKRLRDIKDLPDEALAIVKEWTYREGDEEDYE